jgi:hypothetical protein
MKVSKSVLKAFAIEDMVQWVLSFKIKRNFADEYGQETQEFYEEKIKKIQDKILREL